MRTPSPPADVRQPSRRLTPTFWALAALLLIAAALRFVWLDRMPWGLHADQLGPSLSALDVLAGQRPFAPVEYNLWLHAASFWALGVSPAAVRLLPALVGSLLPLSTYLAVAGPFGRRVALLAAALSAISIWPVVLSRSGLSISYLPVVLGLFLWQLHAAWHSGRARHWVAAGFLLAIAQYIYFPARAVFAVLWLAAAYLLLRGPRRRLWSAWPLLLALMLGVLPVYWGTQQATAEATRYGTVFVLAPENHPGHPLIALGRQAWLAASMFFYQGDQNYRHNVPAHPVYNPLVALAVIAAAGPLLRGLRQPRLHFWLAWMACLLAPMVLSIESPHFLRSAGILPLVFVPPAVGLAELAQRAARLNKPWLGWGAVAVLLLFSLGRTLSAYFGTAYQRSPGLYYAFAGHDLDVAVGLNRFLGAGWQGAGWRVTDITPEPGRQALMADSVWSADSDRQRTLRLLVPVALGASPAFNLVESAPAEQPVDVQLILLQGHEQPAVGLLPHDRTIHLSAGPLAPPWSSLREQRYRAYTTSPPLTLATPPVACFADEIELLQTHTQRAAAGVEVTLLWQAHSRPAFDYNVFTHVVAHDAIVGQVDAFPGDGGYLASWWRPGDVIVDVRTVPVPAAADLRGAYLRVGLYRWDTQARLAATDCAGNSLGDFIVVPYEALR